MTKNFRKVDDFEVKSFMNDFEEALLKEQDKDAFLFRALKYKEKDDIEADFEA